MVFVDWEEGALIRRIDVLPKAVYWNETGEIVLLACDESYFVLKYNKVSHQALARALAGHALRGPSEAVVAEVLESYGLRHVAQRLQTIHTRLLRHCHPSSLTD